MDTHCRWQTELTDLDATLRGVVREELRQMA